MKNADNIQQNSSGSRSGRSLYISLFCFLSAFFFGMLIIWGVPMYNDSKQYLDMHVHREPVYPLFLWVMRLIAGENSLILAGVVQCMLAVYASYRFITYVVDNVIWRRIGISTNVDVNYAEHDIQNESDSKFPGNSESDIQGKNDLKVWKWLITLAVTVAVIIPYIITPLMSVTHVMLANGILSEALALPLFLLYVINLHMMMVERTSGGEIRIRHIAVSFILAFILSLTRSQMIVTLIAWIIVAVMSVLIPLIGDKGRVIIKNDNNENPVISGAVNVNGDNIGAEIDRAVDKRRLIKKCITVIVLVLAFFISIPLRTTLTKMYNQTFNGRYVDNVYTKLTMLSNIFYVTDRESGELIEDEDTRNIFYRLYDMMDGNEWSYKYAGDSAAERAVYLEDMHDKVKFDVLEAGFRDIMNERGMPDYIDYNLKAEEYSGRLIGTLWPECFGKWFADWLIMGCRGVVRSIAICHPIMYIYVAAVLLYLSFGIIMCLKKAREVACFGSIAMLLLLGNAFGTAFTIMCLSRYMIYCFAPFYSALIVLVYIKRMK